MRDAIGKVSGSCVELGLAQLLTCDPYWISNPSAGHHGIDLAAGPTGRVYFDRTVKTHNGRPLQTMTILPELYCPLGKIVFPA